MSLRSGSITTFSSGAQNTTTFPINSPVGVAAGDLVVIFGCSTSNGNETWSSPGFTVGDTLNQTTSLSQGPHATMSWLWKIAGASEPATYTVTTSLALFTDCEAFCGAWTGRNTASPITASLQTKTAGTGSPHTYALTGITAAANDDLVTFVIAAQNATMTWVDPTVPSGWGAGTSILTATPFGNAYLGHLDNFVAGGATGTVNPKETGVGTDNLGFVIAFAAAPTNSLACAFGSFALAGKAAGLAVNSLPAGIGFFTLAGQAATLSLSGAPLVLLAAPGVFNVTGASSLTNYQLDAAQGSFSLGGFPVEFGGTGIGLNLPAQQAGFNYQGFPATLAIATISAGSITAAAGGFNLAGQSAVLTISNLPPSSSGVLGRPGGRTIFSAKKVSESVNFIWDFISSLAPGETILTNQITATTYMGNDTNPAGIVGGPAVVSGTQVFQLILGGLIGQIYAVSCNITTSTGQSITESAYLAIEPDLP